MTLIDPGNFITYAKNHCNGVPFLKMAQHRTRGHETHRVRERVRREAREVRETREVREHVEHEEREVQEHLESTRHVEHEST